MDFNYVFFPDHLTCKCTLHKKMRHFCDIGLHNCNFLLDYNDLTPLQVMQRDVTADSYKPRTFVLREKKHE